MTNEPIINHLDTLSTADVASKLRCAEKTVRFLEDSKQLRFLWIGGRRRVRETDLIEFMTKGGQRFSRAAWMRNPEKYEREMARTEAIN